MVPANAMVVLPERPSTAIGDGQMPGCIFILEVQWAPALQKPVFSYAIFPLLVALTKHARRTIMISSR